MENIRLGKIEQNNISNLDVVAPAKAMLTSSATLFALNGRELPLVHRGPLPYLSKEETTPTQVQPESPLVNASPNNPFVAAASAAAGFDVTSPVPTEEKLVENVIDSQVNIDVPSVDNFVTPESFDAPQSSTTEQTPEIAKEEEFVEPPKIQTNFDIPVVQQPTIDVTPISESTFTSPTPPTIAVPTEPVLQTPNQFETLEREEKLNIPSQSDPHVLINIKIEDIRKRVIEECKAIIKRVEDMEKEINRNLDEISRQVEHARQISIEDNQAINNTLNKQMESLQSSITNYQR